MDAQNLRSIIKSARDILRTDDGLSSDVDRIPQLTWILFLKCFDDYEKNRKKLDKKYVEVIPKGLRWRDWAEEKDGEKILTGDDLKNFVNNELFPKLSTLVSKKGIEQRDIINSVFRQFYNTIQSGYILRKVVNKIAEVNFVSTDDIHTLGSYYENMLIEMRDAAGKSGEFYTPRPVIRFIVNQIDPDLQKSPRILDPASGTGGFLIESLNHMKPQIKSKNDIKKLSNTVFGIEKKPMPYLLGIMNMLLHDVDRPNIVRSNTLGKPLREITENDQYDIIMTNPPFGGEEEKELKSNLPVGLQTSDTAVAFLLYIMYSLKKGGKCAIILPDGAPLSTGSTYLKIRKKLLEEFNLHTIIRLPRSVFAPYTDYATNILFFENKGTSKDIWYYRMNIPDRIKQIGIDRGKKIKDPKFNKTNPIVYQDFEDIEKWMKNKIENENAWKVNVDDLEDYILDRKHPDDKIEEFNLSLHENIDQILENEKNMIELIEEIKEFIKKEIPK